MRGTLILLPLLLFSCAQGCQPNWLEHEGLCYFFADITGSWAEAGSYCRNFNSKLAEPSVPSAAKFLQDEVKTKHPSKGEYYLGGADFFVEGDWRWESFQLPIKNGTHNINWSPNEPNNLAGKEDCLALTLSGFWNDVPCDTSLPFICQMEDDEGVTLIG